MEIENDKILQKASMYWGQPPTKGNKQQYLNRQEVETAASVCEVEPNRDFLDRIFTKSTSIWYSLFSSSKESPKSSRKNSSEITLIKQQEPDVCDLFHVISPQEPEVEEHRQQEEEFADFAEDSYPALVKPYYSGRQQDQQDPLIEADSLFYLDENVQEIPKRQQPPSIPSNEYLLQNVTESKIRIRRTNLPSFNVKRKPFTNSEDEVIIESIKKHGRNFSLIAKSLPGRTEQMVRNRYKSKIRKLLKRQNEEMDTESDQNKEQPSSFDIASLQELLKSQFTSESINASSSDLEKLQKIKQLQFEISKIEDLLQSTKSEIIKEYISILHQ